MKKILFCVLLQALATAGLAGNDDRLASAMKGDHRSAANKARDVYRHPNQTLTFFAISPEQTVVEIWPGKGWYTEILAPLLKEQGTFYAAHFSADSEVPYFQNSLQEFKQKLAERPDVYNRVILTELQPPDELTIAPAGTVDTVLTFRNVHNWMKNEQAEMVFGAIYQALKPGGVLGVVEHRNPPDIEQDPRAISGYVSEAAVIELAESAGLKLVERAEINANPKDNSSHPKGVWTLPPTLRVEDREREKYLAIGESDRMTLKFVKP